MIKDGGQRKTVVLKDFISYKPIMTTIQDIFDTIQIDEIALTWTKTIHSMVDSAKKRKGQ
jgi:hypothetical protein